MKIRLMTLLLALIGSLILLFSSSNSVSTTSAQQEGGWEQNISRSNRPKDASADGTSCGTPPVEEAEKQRVEKALQRFRQERSRQDTVESYSLAGTVTIPVYFHVINQGAGLNNGDVPEYMLDAQIDVLNRSFGGETGGAGTSFRFVKVGVTRTTDVNWFRMVPSSGVEFQAKSALRQGGAETLNFYTIGDNHPTQPYAWAWFPWQYSGSPIHDGVVCPFTMLPGGGSAQFGEGDIGTHEVGHWLGLLHTFQDGCTTPNDLVADTPAHTNTIGGCPYGSDSCPAQPGFDPIDNFMQNAADYCKYRFTPGQAARMDEMYSTYRQPAVSATASVTSVAPSEVAHVGPPNTMTVTGYAQNGFGDVQMVWRDATAGGGWNVVAEQATPNPADNSWWNTIPSSNKCHDYWVYVNYWGYQSPIFVYNGVNSGYCDERVDITWIQPQHTAGFGPPGSLIVAGSASGAPPGTQVYIQYRDLTVRSGWVYHPYAPIPDSNGTWLMDIPNVDFSHVYQVLATYDVVTDNCTYWGNNSISWCQ